MGNEIRISTKSTLIEKGYKRNKIWTQSFLPESFILFGNKADFTLTDVLGTMLPGEHCPFKAVSWGG